MKIPTVRLGWRRTQIGTFGNCGWLSAIFPAVYAANSRVEFLFARFVNYADLLGFFV